jgi:hypothetical protein
LTQLPSSQDRPSQQSYELVQALPWLLQQVPELHEKPEQHCELFVQELPPDPQALQVPFSQMFEQQSLASVQLSNSSLHAEQLPS